MPTILRIRGYRIGFYQADLVEQIHVHVRRQGAVAKYWMDPIELAGVRGFRPHELGEIEKILEEHRDQVVSAWRNEEAKRGDSAGED
jgi:heme-degrading monooxygenase HmoA